MFKYKKIVSSFFVLLLLICFTTSTLSAQEAKAKESASLNSIDQNHAFSINVAPLFSSLLTGALMGGFGSMSSGSPLSVFGIGLGAGYEYAFTDFMTLGVDMNVYYIDLDVHSQVMFDWDIGAKFFVANRAPIGFFLEPKIGGIYIEAFGDTENINMYTTTLTVELGWRFLLFKESGKDWNTKFAIDFSLVEFGYQNLSYASESDHGLKENAFFYALIPTLAFTVLF